MEKACRAELSSVHDFKNGEAGDVEAEIRLRTQATRESRDPVPCSSCEEKGRGVQADFCGPISRFEGGALRKNIRHLAYTLADQHTTLVQQHPPLPGTLTTATNSQTKEQRGGHRTTVSGKLRDLPQTGGGQRKADKAAHPPADDKRAVSVKHPPLHSFRDGQ